MIILILLFKETDGIGIWRVKRCGKELSLAREPNSNSEMRQLMKERCNSVCWAHRENILYIIDKKGNLIVCDPLKEEFDYVVCGPALRRHLVNLESAYAEVKPHTIGVVLFLSEVILLVRLDDTMAELVTEYHVEAHSCLRPVQFANDSYVAWTETGNLMHVEATGMCHCHHRDNP